MHVDDDSKTSPGGTLGDMIRKQRELASLTMRQLSAMSGISNPYLSQIEHGLREPSQSVLHEIAKSLGMEPDDLTPGETHVPGVAEAIADDAGLTAAQRRALTEVYTSMITATAAKRAARKK